MQYIGWSRYASFQKSGTKWQGSCDKDSHDKDPPFIGTALGTSVATDGVGRGAGIEEATLPGAVDVDDAAQEVAGVIGKPEPRSSQEAEEHHMGGPEGGILEFHELWNILYGIPWGILEFREGSGVGSNSTSRSQGSVPAGWQTGGRQETSSWAEDVQLKSEVSLLIFIIYIYV